MQTQKLTINYTPTNVMVLIDSKPYKGGRSLDKAGSPTPGTAEWRIASAVYWTSAAATSACTLPSSDFLQKICNAQFIKCIKYYTFCYNLLIVRLLTLVYLLYKDTSPVLVVQQVVLLP